MTHSNSPGICLEKKVISETVSSRSRTRILRPRPRPMIWFVLHRDDGGFMKMLTGFLWWSKKSIGWSFSRRCSIPFFAECLTLWAQNNADCSLQIAMDQIPNRSSLGTVEFGYCDSFNTGLLLSWNVRILWQIAFYDTFAIPKSSNIRFLPYREWINLLAILLSNSQAGPGRKSTQPPPGG